MGSTQLCESRWGNVESWGQHGGVAWGESTQLKAPYRSTAISQLLPLHLRPRCPPGAPRSQGGACLSHSSTPASASIRKLGVYHPLTGIKEGWQPHQEGAWCSHGCARGGPSSLPRSQPPHLPAFFTKPRSASSTSHSSHRKQPGCQLVFMALMTRPMMNSPGKEEVPACQAGHGAPKP